MTQEIPHPPTGFATPGRVDPVRLEQFLDLTGDLQRAALLPAALAERLAHLLLHTTASDRIEICWQGWDGAYQRVEAGPAGTEPHAVTIPFTIAATPGRLTAARSSPHRPEDIALLAMLARACAQALERAAERERMGAVARQRHDALATMAHDLRTPLNGLIGYTQLLAEGAFGALSTEQRDVIGTLARQAAELVELLNATLDVARIESPHLPLRLAEFSVERITRELSEGSFAAPSRAGLLQWRVGENLPLLVSDRVKLKEVVQNLVGNALHHRGEHPVEVEVSAAPMADGIRVRVRDRGPGIAPDLMPHLFEPGRTTRSDGHGLGLYIVRRFVEALGAQLAVESAPHLGTSMILDLPRCVAPRR